MIFSIRVPFMKMRGFISEPPRIAKMRGQGDLLRLSGDRGAGRGALAAGLYMTGIDN